MADILYDFQILAPPEKVFEAITSSEGVSAWWSKTTTGNPEEGAVYELDFGPEYQWKARVTKCHVATTFEWEMTECNDEWRETRIGFILDGNETATKIRFHHTGWPEQNAHYRVSSYCWAMYLRILKRYVEFDEFVPYEDRLSV